MAQIKFESNANTKSADDVAEEIYGKLESGEMNILHADVARHVESWNANRPDGIVSARVALVIKSLEVLEVTISKGKEGQEKVAQREEGSIETKKENPFKKAAENILSIIENGFESKEDTLSIVLKRRKSSIVKALTRGRKGKQALPAQKVWDEMKLIKPTLGVSDEDAECLFAKLFSTLVTA